MSAKSRRIKKVDLGPAASDQSPRSMDEINDEYGRLVAQCGQAQYQVFVYSEDIKRMNEALRGLNYEAAARKNLDAARAKTEEPSNES